MTMGEKILNMRKARGWSQEELADRVGVTRQAVSRWESGSAKPDAEKIVAICDLFGVSADYLLRDRYSGEGSWVETEKQPVYALTAKARSMTLRQWASCGIVLSGGMLLLILKLVYVFQDTNYSYYTAGGCYTGFHGFVMGEDLTFVWLLGLIAFWGGLFYLICWPIIRREKEKNPWPWERK